MRAVQVGHAKFVGELMESIFRCGVQLVGRAAGCKAASGRKLAEWNPKASKFNFSLGNPLLAQAALRRLTLRQYISSLEWV